MSKEGVIYASGVRPRTDMILRAFAAKNNLTLSQLMDILAHVVSGYGTEKLFNVPNSPTYNPVFRKFDEMMRAAMDQALKRQEQGDVLVEQYKRLTLLDRLFGKMFKPLTRQELERIDVALTKGDDGQEEVPDVEL